VTCFTYEDCTNRDYRDRQVAKRISAMWMRRRVETDDSTKDVTFVGILVFHAKVDEASSLVLANSVAEKTLEKEIRNKSRPTSEAGARVRLHLDGRVPKTVGFGVHVARSLPISTTITPGLPDSPRRSETESVMYNHRAWFWSELL